MSKESQQVVLFFDSDCAFCTTIAKFGKRLLLHVEFQPMHSIDLVSRGVDPLRARVEVPVRLEDGTVVYGHRAVAAVLKTGALPLLWVGEAMTWGPLNRLSAWCYRVVSEHRHLLSRGSSVTEAGLVDDEQ